MRNGRSLTFVALATSLGLIAAIALASFDGSPTQPPRTEVAAFDGSGDPAPRTEVAAAQAPETDLTTNAQTAPADGGPGEAVRVHGHWTIEIREPDGSLVRTVEFENALTPEGAVTLPELLARTRSVGTWSIELTGSNRACRFGAIRASCLLIEAQDTPAYPAAAFPNAFPTLRVRVPAATEPNAGKLVLAGTATAQSDGDVGVVITFLVVCDPSAPPTSCGSFSANRGGLPFTGATLQPSQSVTAGQQILVTVVISFR